MYEPFINQCVVRPQYALLQRGYEAYVSNSQPCRRAGPNQCAVRMSIALGRAGFGLESFPSRQNVHSGDGGCATDSMSHVTSAVALATWLRNALGDPLIIRPPSGTGGCADALEQIRGRTGVVYFNNCFTRQGGTAQVGDHIDLFNGQRYYNDINDVRAGGTESIGGGGHLFGDADQVWFWQLA